LSYVFRSPGLARRVSAQVSSTDFLNAKCAGVMKTLIDASCLVRKARPSLEKRSSYKRVRS